jgi:hypothetical protein
MGTLPQLRASIGKLVVRKVDRLSCVRFGSARYSVPNLHIGRQVELVAQDAKILVVFLGEIVAEHDLVAPGETSILDGSWSSDVATYDMPGSGARQASLSLG